MGEGVGRTARGRVKATKIHNEASAPLAFMLCSSSTVLKTFESLKSWAKMAKSVKLLLQCAAPGGRSINARASDGSHQMHCSGRRRLESRQLMSNCELPHEKRRDKLHSPCEADATGGQEA